MTAVIVAPASSKLLFVDNFDGALANNWTHIGDGKISIAHDRTAPEFGPKVLELANPNPSNCIAYLEDFIFTDGVITYLIRDMDLSDGLDFDADGPGFARLIHRPEEIPVLMAFPAAYAIELDLDTGFHILWGENGGGRNISVDAITRTTGEWTWVKFSLMGNELKGKTWLAGEKEPQNWQLVGTDDRYTEGAIAMRIWSGAMYIAHIRVNDMDEPYIAVQPKANKLALTWGAFKTDRCGN